MVSDTTKTSGRKGRPAKAKAEEAQQIVDKIIESNGFDTIEEAASAESKIEYKVEKQEERPIGETKIRKETKKEFAPNDSILCRSVVSGGLYMDGLVSGMPYTWVDFGDEVGVEYRDLVAAVRTKNSYVMRPFFVIMDDDFVNSEAAFLKSIYTGQYSIKDLANVLLLPIDEMTSEIKKLPGNVKETLKGIASTWVSNGRLDSFKKIKALDEMLDTDLSLIAEMVED